MAPCGCQLRDGGARHGADAPDRAPHRDTAHAVEAAGMTFLAPIFFYVGLGVAVAAVGLHLIVTRQPLSSLLPTVRFESGCRVPIAGPPVCVHVICPRPLLWSWLPPGRFGSGCRVTIRCSRSRACCPPCGSCRP